MKESHISSQMWEKDQDKEKERGKTQWKRLYNVTMQKKNKKKLNESGMCPYRRQWLLHSQIKTGRIKKRLQSGAGRQATGRRHSLLRPVHATELMTCFSTDIWGAGSRAKREKLDWRREILKVIMRWCNGGVEIWGRGHNWEHGTIPRNSVDACGGLWASSTHTTVTCQR